MALVGMVSYIGSDLEGQHAGAVFTSTPLLQDIVQDEQVRIDQLVDICTTKIR